MNTLQKNLLLAKNSTDPAVLTGLAADRNNGVVRLVGSNAATPPEILAILLNHQNPSVREWTIKNPATPLDRVNDIRDREDLPKVKTAIRDRLAGLTDGVEAGANATFVDPNGCRWCGELERSHCSRYTKTVGYHTYVSPTDGQRKDRMLAAVVARNA